MCTESDNVPDYVTDEEPDNGTDHVTDLSIMPSIELFVVDMQ